MKPSHIYDILDMALRARELGEIFNPLFISPPGLGKTEIMQQWAKARKLPSLTLTSALLEAPDIRGFPIVEVVNGRQKMTTAIPDMWPDAGRGIIILEEVNRGTTSVMNCWMGLTDARRGFDNYKLPEGYIVAGCINPETSLYDTNSMDPALKDRFEMFQVTYDKESFLSYMKDTGWHKDIILFVETGLWNYLNPEDIKNAPGSKYISPRTFSKLNAALKAGFDDTNELLIYGSILGTNIGKDFYSFRHNESPVFYYDLVHNLSESLSKLKKFSDPTNYKNGLISLTLKDVVENNEIEDKLLFKLVEVLSAEKATTLISELEFKRKDKTIFKRVKANCPEFAHQFTEIIKHGK